MDWKKENISATELEKRQKEYMNEAIAMMKKSGDQSVHSIPLAEAPKSDDKPKNEDPPAEPERALTEEASDELSEADAAQTDEIDETDDDKYGVYTADELLNGEYSGEGLKKAAEILEEMTRNTEMMKKLADGDDDPDTTDFPDFSDGDCTNSGGGRFRENEETSDSPTDNE